MCGGSWVVGRVCFKIKKKKNIYIYIYIYIYIIS